MQMHKVQISLTPEEIAALSLKGKRLGYSATKYVKFLIMREAYSVVESIPSYQLTSELEEKTLQALKEYRQKKTKKLKSPADFKRV